MRTSLDTLTAHLKPHLDYDGSDTYRFLSPKELRSIKATHGTTIEAVADLLIYGSLQKRHRVNDKERDDSILNDEFYTTPNPRFGFDPDALDGEFDTAELAGVDAILAGIEYAEGGDTAYDNGAIIAFSGKLSLEGAKIYTDPLFTSHAEASNGIELVLPKAPSLDVVAGIYPVDEQAHQDLLHHIDRVLQ